LILLELEIGAEIIVGCPRKPNHLKCEEILLSGLRIHFTVRPFLKVGRGRYDVALPVGRARAIGTAGGPPDVQTHKSESDNAGSLSSKKSDLSRDGTILHEALQEEGKPAIDAPAQKQRGAILIRFINSRCVHGCLNAGA